MATRTRFILAGVWLLIELPDRGALVAAQADGLVLTVDMEDDGVDADPGNGRCATDRGRCTLRAAVQEANATPGHDRIVLEERFNDLEIEGAGEDGAATGDLDITDDLTIEGEGAFASSVGTRTADGIFHVLPGVAAELKGFNFGGGVALLPYGTAGGIFNQGTLHLDDVAVTGNIAVTYGTAGLLNEGKASVEHSYFYGNTPDAITNNGDLEVFDTTFRLNGGYAVRSDSGSFTMRASEIVDQTGSGVFCQEGPTLIEHSIIHRTRPGPAVVIPSAQVTVRDSIIEANEGGGFNNDGVLRIERSTLRANSRFDLDASDVGTGVAGGGAGVAGVTPETGVTNTDTTIISDSTITGHRGGGVVNEEGRVTLVNVTISGNSCAYGAGGVTNYQELVVRGSTITGNRCDGEPADAGGLATYEDLSATVRLSNTIIAGNTSNTGSPDCWGPTLSDGHNLIGDSRGCGELATADGDLLDAAPALGPLADNGGPTRTHALLDGSAAIDAGSPLSPGTDPTACAPNDQRGAGRPQGASCDIGAFEVATSCGDGVLDTGEACDDGNVDAGDCCSPLCRFELLAGDCDASGAVEIEDLMRSVAIALGNVSLDECSIADLDGDGTLSIGELVRAVQASLAGCSPNGTS